MEKKPVLLLTRFWPAAFFVYGLALNCASSSVGSSPETRVILERQKSQFGLVSVYDVGDKRYISIGEQEQSGVNLKDKREWVYTYTYLLSLGILTADPQLESRPAHALIIGLGGGSFADFLAEVYPRWNVDVVEIDPAVIRLAKKYFPINGRVKIIQDDGRAYLKKKVHKYDVIVMDAFGEHYIPPELYTAEYFSLLRQRLVPGGLVLMNTWENNPLEAFEMATLRKVFAQGYFILHPKEDPGNRIYIMGDTLESADVLKHRIGTEFSRRRFSGDSPGDVLHTMKNLHEGPFKGYPITDANVRALFKKYRPSED
jgi:spermidine synthase